MVNTRRKYMDHCLVEEYTDGKWIDGSHRLTTAVLFVLNKRPFTFQSGYNIDKALVGKTVWFSDKPSGDEFKHDLVLVPRLRYQFMNTLCTVEIRQGV